MSHGKVARVPNFLLAVVFALENPLVNFIFKVAGEDLGRLIWVTHERSVKHFGKI